MFSLEQDSDSNYALAISVITVVIIFFLMMPEYLLIAYYPA